MSKGNKKPPRDFEAFRQGLYREEYDAATTLIASVIWSQPGERSEQAIDQLKELNARIRAKNSRSKRKHDHGTVDIVFFSKFGDDIDEAARAYIGNNQRDKFVKAQTALRSVIKASSLPDGWNIDWEQFQDYCGGRQWEVEGAPSNLSTDNLKLHQVPTDETGSDDLESDEEQSIGSIVSKYEHRSDEEGNDTGFSPDQSPSGTASESDDDEDGPVIEWQSSESLEHSCRRAEKEYGVPFNPGVTLGWRKIGQAGYSLIIGHRYQGKTIARVIRSATSPDTQEANIDLNARGHIKGSKKYTSASVQGTGLVAWRVGAANDLNATAPLRPAREMSYPETYIGVHWRDGVWTWESRENFRSIMEDLTPLQADILIYHWAISQDGEYKEALTGQKPSYPGVSPFDVHLPETTSDAGSDTESEAESLSDLSSYSGRSATPPHPSEDSVQSRTPRGSSQVPPSRRLRFQRLPPVHSAPQNPIKKTNWHGDRHQLTRFPRYRGGINR